MHFMSIGAFSIKRIDKMWSQEFGVGYPRGDDDGWKQIWKLACIWDFLRVGESYAHLNI